MRSAGSRLSGLDSERGFTLIEFLAAAVLLSIGLLAIATLLTTAITLNTLGRSTNEAMAEARVKIEELKILPETDPQRAVGGSIASDVTGYNDTRGIYHRRWQVDAGPSGSRRYTVRVIPTRGDLRTRQPVTVATIF